MTLFAVYEDADSSCQRSSVAPPLPGVLEEWKPEDLISDSAKDDVLPYIPEPYDPKKVARYPKHLVSFYPPSSNWFRISSISIFNNSSTFWHYI